MRVSTTLVEQRQGFNFWKIVEHTYRFPFGILVGKRVGYVHLHYVILINPYMTLINIIQVSWRHNHQLKVVLSCITKILYARPLSHCSISCMVSTWSTVHTNCIVYSQLHICCHLSGQYIHDDPNPYSKTEECGLKIDGLPTSCTLKHPSYGKYSQEQREFEILWWEREIYVRAHVMYVYMHVQCVHVHTRVCRVSDQSFDTVEIRTPPGITEDAIDVDLAPVCAPIWTLLGSRSWGCNFVGCGFYVQLKDTSDIHHKINHPVRSIFGQSS